MGHFDAIDEVIEFGKLIDVVPNSFVAGVEDMRTIPMNVDAFNFFGVTVASDMVSFVNNKNFFACRPSLLCKGGTEDSGTYYKEIVHVNCIQC